MKLKLFLLLFLVCFSFSAYAVIRTVYQSSIPIDIYTKTSMSTILIFDNATDFINMGNSEYFHIYQDEEKKDKIIITPKKVGVNTNLQVITKDGNAFVFNLIEDKYKQHDDLVNVKPKEQIPHELLINIINKKRIHIDSDLSRYINTYDLEDKVIVNDEYFDLEIIKGAIIHNVDETAYWIRLYNKTDKEFTINKIGLEERNLVCLGTNNNLTKVSANNSLDFYLFVEGRGIDTSLTFNIFSGGINYIFSFEDIAFIQNNITIFDFK